MHCHTWNEKGDILIRSSVRRVAQLKLQTSLYKYMCVDVDNSIKDKLKCKYRGYADSKPNPEDYTDLTKFGSNFNEEFNKIYNDQYIKYTY